MTLQALPPGVGSVDFDSAELLRANSAPVSRGPVTVQSTLPNANTTGAISSETRPADGAPMWIEGVKWTPIGCTPVQIDEIVCDCEDPDVEMPGIEDCEMQCGCATANAFRVASPGFEARCYNGPRELPALTLDRQMSKALAVQFGKAVVAAAASTGLDCDGEPILDGDGDPVPGGDASAGKCICVSKGLGVLRSHREINADGTLGVLFVASTLQDYMLNEGFVTVVDGGYQLHSGEPVVFVPNAALTGPAGESGEWIYTANAADWVATDVVTPTLADTVAERRGNRTHFEHAQAYGLVRVDSCEAYAVCVVGGCDGCETDVSAGGEG